MSFSHSSCLRSLAAIVVVAGLTACGTVGDPSAADEVTATVRDHTDRDLPIPANQLEQADVDAFAAALLARPLTADLAAQVALLKSRRLRATLEDLNLSQADLLEASLPANPNLASSIRWPHQGGGRNVEMELAGDVLNWLLLPLRRKMALREYAAARHRVTHEVLDVIFEVKEAMYELQARQQILDRTLASAEVSGITSDMASRLRAAGNITELELLQEQTSLQQADLEIQRARGELATAREAVSRLMGLTSAEASRWRAATNLPSLPSSDPTQSRAESLAVAQRQDLAAERETLAALTLGYSLTQKLRFVPGVTAGVSSEREVDGARLTGPTLDIELPLFNRGQGRMRRSSAELARAQASLEALELEVRSDVRTALVQVRAARAVYAQIASQVLPQRQRILRETLLQYNAMQVSNFALLRAKEDEVRTQRDLIEAARDYWTARARLEKAIGASLTKSHAKSARSISASSH